ncbi:peptidyl-prolyl cis-trans isomerase [Tsuneonella deserti]|uniref:peptidylprolyl isomerase n=1 Tax=Tsuneonella deserti TaxID=2035528 RepID=A0ABQ1SAW3_9SPHN|nr:peptidylprolyl isomerase [Tsuneonella deserti]GGD96861.1 peptidyl-prolyl cis-trans isomerase [Tsuneonella deserti]
MKSLLACAALFAVPAYAAEETRSLSPAEIVAAAPQEAWSEIAADDLLVMTLAPDRNGTPRRVVIQLIAEPYSEAWTANIRTLAKAHWWDGLAIVRAQDNYVVQWGDPDGEEAGKARPLPQGLRTTSESQYTVSGDAPGWTRFKDVTWPRGDVSHYVSFDRGWPIEGAGTPDSASHWPVHCYGSVGVGRNLSPDAGTGAELYAVIGHAPRQLDRNIAVVGRVVEGIEHLSVLPRGTGPLGFYATPGERTGIVSIRLASDLSEAERPRFEYLISDTPAFARYVDARANRRDEFFIAPAGGVDVCNAPVPVRKLPTHP